MPPIIAFVAVIRPAGVHFVSRVTAECNRLQSSNKHKRNDARFPAQAAALRQRPSTDRPTCYCCTAANALPAFANQKAKTTRDHPLRDTSAQIALIKIWLAEKMEITVPEVEEKLGELANLLPDLVGKMERARADVLYELLKDTTATAERLLALRELLPRCNVSALVAGHPRLMLGMSVAEVKQQVQDLRSKLPGVDVDSLIMQEPMLLRADVPRLMSELARLMPNADPVRLIASDPQMVLDMDVAGMPSTLELEGVGLEQQ